MDIFLSTYEDGVCVRREWLVRKAYWYQGSNWILTDVGSHPNCDIVISHPSVKYQHFVIDIAKDTLDMWIKNLTGTGKLRVRGKEVKPYSKRQIYPGDIIQIGMMNSWMRIEAASWPENRVQRMTAILDRRIESIQRRSLSNAVIPPPESEPESEDDNENEEEGSSEDTSSEEDSPSTHGVEEESTDEECVGKDAPHNVSSEENTGRIQSMVPPPRRTGIARVYRRFFSTPSRGRPEQWVKLQKDEALGVVELKPPLRVKRRWQAHDRGRARPQEGSTEKAKQLLEQHRAMIGQLPRDYGPRQLQGGWICYGQNPTPQRPNGSPAEGPCASIANGVGCKWANRLPPCKPTVSRHCEVNGGGRLGPTWEDPSSLGYMAAVGGVGGAANVKKKGTRLEPGSWEGLSQQSSGPRRGLGSAKAARSEEVPQHGGLQDRSEPNEGLTEPRLDESGVSPPFPYP
ncbi:hypothetical protein EJ110_NYTH53475 [Nymphaea thermarum]|nr:hypothetical protein EJ110_NYTH53475 [Nymphaea thermarum]